MIVLLAGLPATGKSALARALSAEIGAVILNKDDIRAALFPPSRVTYTTEQDDFCQTLMLQTAEYLFMHHSDEVVILDGRTFSRSYQIEAVRDCAAQLQQRLVIIECVCSDETARLRLERDTAAGTHPAGNRSFDLYKAIQARFEPIAAPKLVVATDGDLGEVVKECVGYIQRAA